jgi:hypothetical protein
LRMVIDRHCFWMVKERMAACAVIDRGEISSGRSWSWMSDSNCSGHGDGEE